MDETKTRHNICKKACCWTRSKRSRFADALWARRNMHDYKASATCGGHASTPTCVEQGRDDAGSLKLVTVLLESIVGSQPKGRGTVPLPYVPFV